MLLYGKNRVGKTTLACMFPKPLLLIGVEPTKTAGARSVRDVRGVKFLRVKDAPTFRALSAELAESNPFKTVVIDSGTSLESIILADVCGWGRTSELIAFGPYKPGDKVTQDQYTARAEQTRKALRPFLDLDSHLVITANEKDHNPAESRKSSLIRGPHTQSFFGAAFGGGTALWLQDGCDYVCQLFIEEETREVVTETDVNGEKTQEVSLVGTGRTVRRLRTRYHPNFQAGIRTPRRDLPEFIDEPDWEKIKEAFL